MAWIVMELWSFLNVNKVCTIYDNQHYHNKYCCLGWLKNVLMLSTQDSEYLTSFSRFPWVNCIPDPNFHVANFLLTILMIFSCFSMFDNPLIQKQMRKPLLWLLQGNDFSRKHFDTKITSKHKLLFEKP